MVEYNIEEIFSLHDRNSNHRSADFRHIRRHVVKWTDKYLGQTRKSSLMPFIHVRTISKVVELDLLISSKPNRMESLVQNFCLILRKIAKAFLVLPCIDQSPDTATL